MIIMHYYKFYFFCIDAPLQTAGPSLKPNTRHAVCHFPTVLYVIIISKLLLLLCYYSRFIMIYERNFITNVRDANRPQPQNPS